MSRITGYNLIGCPACGEVYAATAYGSYHIYPDGTVTIPVKQLCRCACGQLFPWLGAPRLGRVPAPGIDSKEWTVEECVIPAFLRKRPDEGPLQAIRVARDAPRSQWSSWFFGKRRFHPRASLNFRMYPIAVLVGSD